MQCCCHGLETQGRGQGQGVKLQGQGLDVHGRGQGQGVKLQGQGRGLDVQGRGQGQGVKLQGQGQGLENWSSRTRTFLEDNNNIENN